MLFRDPVANAQAQSGAFANRLGGIERIKHAAGLAEAWSRIVKAHDDSSGLVDRFNADPLYRRPFQSIDGVVQKVQQDLLELIFVKRYGGQISFDFNLDLNVMVAQMVFAQ